MKKRCLTLLVIGTVITIPCCIWINTESREEPIYSGKKYSDWIEQATLARTIADTTDATLDTDPANTFASELRDAQQAVSVINSIGTNAIPFLIDEITVQDSLLDRVILVLLPERLRKHFGIRSKVSRRKLAYDAFRILDSKARPFCPLILQCTNSIKSEIEVERIRQLYLYLNR